LLGPPQSAGAFNETARRFGLDRTGPKARDYSVKMAWAPSRQRALYAGANHGHPHRLNDVWEFDLPTARWLLLYPPDLPRSYTGLGDDASDVEYREGVLITPRGGPAVIGHTWWGLTWDPVLARLLFLNAWVTPMAKVIEQLGGDPSIRFQGLPLWSFDPSRGQWQLLRGGAPTVTAPFGTLLEYVPTLGGSVWHMDGLQGRKTWLFESGPQRWKLLPSTANAPGAVRTPARESVSYYDSVRNLLVAHRGTRSFFFDVDALQWRLVADHGGPSGPAPDAHDAWSPAYFDAVSAQGLLADFRSHTVWAFDPGQLSWQALEPKGPVMPTDARKLCYFDPARNVLVVIGEQIWVYRHAIRG
jgi:hypothetical protein